MTELWAVGASPHNTIFVSPVLFICCEVWKLNRESLYVSNDIKDMDGNNSLQFSPILLLEGP
jgi:hypothetical protein